MLPIAVQDTPMRALAEHLKIELNARLHNAFDAAELPRQDAIADAVPWNPDLQSVRTFPLLAVFRTECFDFAGGRYRAIARWHIAASTLQVPYQQDFLYWVSKNLMNALEEYEDTAFDSCLRVAAETLRAQMSYVTITTAGPNSDRLTALSFPTVQVNFDFVDLEPN
ncbi:MAG: hypothetical protein AAF609_14925 [Cyanobacteria bacterium P01_C01_bin.120]